MGSSKKQTVGYRYYLGMHLVLCHGPIDKVETITVDKRTAWSGGSTGGSVQINAENLFGGEEREGGVSGQVDIEMGRNDQGTNPYLAARLGAMLPAFRGVVGMVLRQCYLGMNPYLKAWGFRGTRLHVRQDGVAQWYDAKVAIPSPDTRLINTVVIHEGVELDGAVYNGPPTAPGKYLLVDGLDPSGTLQIQVVSGAWSRYPTDDGNGGRSWCCGVTVTTDDNVDHEFYDQVGVYPPQWYFPTPGEAFANVQAQPLATVTSSSSYRIHFNDYAVNLNRGSVVLRITYSGAMPIVDMNPAHIIRECLTDPDWGMGYAEADIDDASFTYAADVLHTEQMGMSLLWDRQTPLEDFITEVVKHISASLYVDRTTGKFALKLIRADYDREDLLVLDESHIQKVEGATRPTAGELVNSVTAVYWNSATGENGSVTVQDQALIQMQGAVVNTTLQYPGFTNQAITSRAALRALTSLSTPLLSCTVYADRAASGLNIGDVFRMTWPDLQVNDLVMRVTAMALGDGRSNIVKLTVVEDVFATPPVAVVVVDPNPGTNEPSPSDPPLAPDRRFAMEVPYYEAAQLYGQAQADTTLASGPEVGYVMSGCARPGAELNVVMQTNPGTGFEDAATFDFCPGATLTDAVARGDTVLAIEGGVDLDRVEVGQWAVLGGIEIVRVDALDVGAGTCTVGRGALDTVPTEHAAGSTLLFADFDYGTDPTEYVSGESVGVRLLPASGAGRLDPLLAPVDTVNLAARAIRPYPPGNVKVNGSYWPETIPGSVDLTLAWSHRDRLQQTGGALIAFPDGDVGPEAGTTYTLRLYDEAGLPLRTETGLTGTSYTYDQELADGGAATPEPFWAQTVFLSNLNGAGGATDFIDLKGHVQSAVGGNAQIDTAQYKFGGASARFDGSGDYVRYPDSADWDFGTGDFTVEAWVRFNSFSATVTMVGNYLGASYGWSFQRRNTNVLAFGNGDTLLISRPWSPSNGVWYHVAVCRHETNIRLFIDGVQQGAAATDSTNISGSTNPLILGALQVSGIQQFLNGWLDDVRITKAARYTASFTPPPQELSGITYDARRNGRLTFELASVRDGRESFQVHVYTVRRAGYGFNYGEYYGGT